MNKLLLFLLLLCLLCGKNAIADAPQNTRKLNDTIERVMQQKQFQWRLPRGKFEPEKDSFISRAFQKLDRYMSSFVKKIREWMSKIEDWLNRRSSNPSPSRSSGGFSGSSKLLLYLLAAVVALALLVWFIRLRRMRPAETIAAEAMPSIPDLMQEDLMATQLPEDEWMTLARDLASRGELRLAMRALYMGCLAFLSSRELITIAKFKSNREYQLELHRRAHSYPVALHSFSENVTLLERSWYGNHPVTGETLQHFQINQETLKRETLGSPL